MSPATDLPPLSALSPARLDWRRDDSGQETPHSMAFDDGYFSRHDARLETEHVFIAANRLPERFAAWQKARPFVIGESGFGTGLNMLVAWACFSAHAPPHARLHLVSTEKYPLTRPDLARALAVWPDLAERAARLIAQWPEPVAGVHRLWLDARVTLDLHLGDTTQRLERLDGRVDAWFLDGFAPTKNPAMWHPALFAALAARSRPGATFATFSCAGVVKRGLAAAGFTWRKVPGIGRKSEMLAGEIACPPQDRRRDPTPWYTPPASPVPRHVAVIGAGIAGASVAATLARRGIRVTLLDRQAPGTSGSGNAQGALYVKPAAQTNLQSRFYLAGLLHSRRWLEVLDPKQDLWCPSGVLQLSTSDKERKRQASFLARHSLPKSVVSGVDAANASTLANIPITDGGLDYPLAGWVRPAALCERLTATPGVTLRRAEVTRLEGNPEGWMLWLADGEHMLADQVVIATATQANNFPQTATLPLQPVRGQISQLKLPEGAPTLSRVICAGGYVTPALDGVLTFGASFHPNQTDTEVREGDHAANLAELQRSLPTFVAALREAGAELEAGQLTGRAALRAASPDKSPYAGPVPDAAAWREDYALLAKDATRVAEIPGRHHRGLWISTAHGSRGLASAPLCAELIASRICDEPMPLEQPLVDHLHPGRRIIRDLVQSKSG
ncbi:bifunctional tRNA (5-methylaminomethyl-2-thiouridine)(34)-methyltransferase MnmD/FAD-dependent 5-carboxymethylaminomethyl-2-thiouridine(34) oxidoreductase MnmC [Halomonas sp. TRM85114]|uniref:bifunctional tRNA (5-methylaminomethyl-2-thiouridine)(34)-methyltransferase MnmD/FAD-dependent 5-carboxymethylaminomethyl-2-thiouridine(34) oxidoreductase MnmC n=1 Tax=Halomonas jincaotanensis TaxID=2810616 RepID=UPI001BD61991|nr:bifunctional tRNA (5-methylaminomethyl-2-thiouridine)(34)-methyltransferase MnmD/FAD-dependent 5-carboxymethylaminomethyl-2-thiouridine(34) oxidoreductase MnmC [Halomonas jincaotanensis]MBS9403208.1 bifunctional tRNA (5-methylaminomethyl-2-thiouridine)(34)-methyltransferase MnmD/FAD-dependent 5-carboxymethylaminomethyl-2-thiouridine(34) oxidoreductase MnmC [Halomonas jincaotanensis]